MQCNIKTTNKITVTLQKSMKLTVTANNITTILQILNVTKWWHCLIDEQSVVGMTLLCIICHNLTKNVLYVFVFVLFVFVCIILL